MKLIPALLSSALLFSITAPSFAQSMQPSGAPESQAENPAPKKEKKAKKDKKTKKPQKEEKAK